MRRVLSAVLASAALMGAAGAASAQTVVVERYGHWEPAWGAQPGPPRAMYWRNHRHEWYGHVRSCMVRYQRYDWRRDMYYEGNRWVPCERVRDRDHGRYYDHDHDHDRDYDRR